MWLLGESLKTTQDDSDITTTPVSTCTSLRGSLASPRFAPKQNAMKMRPRDVRDVSHNFMFKKWNGLLTVSHTKSIVTHNYPQLMEFSLAVAGHAPACTVSPASTDGLTGQGQGNHQEARQAQLPSSTCWDRFTEAVASRPT